MEYTPGPWHATPAGYIASEHDGFVPLLTPFRPDAHRDQHSGPTPIAQANAQFIVRAVNNHDALVEALEPLARLAEDSPSDASDTRCLYDGCFEGLSLGDARRARAAIEQAKASH